MTPRQSWGVFLATAALLWLPRLADASNLGEFAEAGMILSGVIGLGYLIGIAAIVYGGVQAVIQFFGRAYGNEWLHALAGIGVGSVLLFVIMPRLTGAGATFAATVQ